METGTEAEGLSKLGGGDVAGVAGTGAGVSGAAGGSGLSRLQAVKTNTSPNQYSFILPTSVVEELRIKLVKLLIATTMKRMNGSKSFLNLLFQLEISQISAFVKQPPLMRIR